MKLVPISTLLVLFSLIIPAIGGAQDGEGLSREEPPYYIYSLYFGGGSYFIDSDQVVGLNEWLEKVPLTGDRHEISVHSHTDNIGSVEYNARLARMRSLNTIDKLADYGIDPAMIAIEDFGELNPVYSNDSWEGRIKNRRVDIIIRPLAL